MRRSVVLGSVMALLLGLLVAVLGGASAVADPSAGPGEYVALTPTRILDTRTSGQTVAARGTLDLPVAGAAGVPAADRVSAVVLNLTATNAAARGYVTAYPSGTAQPTTSVLNFGAGETRAHSVVVAPGSDGVVRLFNGAQSSIDLVADVTGYYAAGTPTDAGQFALLPQARLLDTRTTLGGHHGQLHTGETFELPVTGHGAVPASVSGVLVNVTVTRPTRFGYVAVGQQYSTVNVVTGQTASNLAVVALSTSGALRIFVDGPSTDVVVDVFGYYLPGSPWAAGRLGQTTGARLLDTRYYPNTPIPAGGTRTLQVSGRNGIPNGTTAAAVNLTVASPTGSGYLTVYPGDTARPVASTLNFTGRTTANSTIATLSADGSVTIYNGSANAQQVVVDASAYVGAVPGPYHWGTQHLFSSTPVQMIGISCVSASFCAAVGNADGHRGYPSRAWFWNGSSWTAGSTVSSTTGLTAVSCVSPTFCMAMADTGSFRWNGSAWTAFALPDPTGYALDTRAVSCVSTTFCMAGGGVGDKPFTWRWDGSAWSESDPGITGSDGRPDVSCASPTFCVAVSSSFSQWVSSVWNGTSWRAGPTATTRADAAAMDCGLPTTCTVVGDTSIGESRTTDGTTWSSPVSFAGEPTGVSCLESTRCVLATRDNAISVGDGTTWTSPASLDPSGYFEPSGAGYYDTIDISCPTADFCAFLDSNGAIVGRVP